MHITEFLKEYDALGEHLENLKSVLADFINSKLTGHEKKIHMLKIRVKTREGLIDKLLNKGQVYKSLSDVHDLVGARVITYYESHLKDIEDIFRNYFSIDKEQSMNKIQRLNPDQFGYLSWHRVVFLPEEIKPKLTLPGKDHFRFEIQLRTLLQHSWAHNSHALDYDNPVGLPAPLKRRLHRVAALLETADREFSEVAKEIETYVTEILGNIENSDAEIPLNTISLEYFISRSPAVKETDTAITASTMGEVKLSHGFIELLPFNLKWAGLNSIAELGQYLQNNRAEVTRFAQMRLKNDEIMLFQGMLPAECRSFMQVY